MDLVIDPQGGVRGLYAEAIDLGTLGRPMIIRASHVEPDATGGWWADLAPVSGPRLGPFPLRSQALQAEATWLDEHFLDASGNRPTPPGTCPQPSKPGSLTRANQGDDR